jgi:hypothetical protein
MRSPEMYAYFLKKRRELGELATHVPKSYLYEKVRLNFHTFLGGRFSE